MLPLTADPIAATICLVAILIGTITDLKTREVPDWVNFSLIALGLGYALIKTIVFWDALYLIASVAGLIAFVAIGMGMFYTGQWGGGDSKMLMGIGASIGLSVADYSSWLVMPPFLLDFLVYSLVAGALYGLAWSIGLAWMNRKEFIKRFTEELKEAQKVKAWLLAGGIIGTGLALLMEGQTRILLLSGIFVTLLTFYAFLFIKAIEGSCMIKNVRPEQLTEGDWIADEIVLDKKTFLKKGIVGDTAIKAIREHLSSTKVLVRPRWSPVAFKRRVSGLKEGDRIREGFVLGSLGIRQGQRVDEPMLSSIDDVLRRNTLLPVKIKTRILRLERVVEQHQLRKGDTLLEPAMTGYYLAGPSDLGIERRQIAALIRLKEKSKVSLIKTKVGIPFVPSFLFAFFLAVFLPGSWLNFLYGILVR
jgi:Flp pilus assembly protein protease CpaA